MASNDDQVCKIKNMVCENKLAAQDTLDEQDDLDVHDDLFNKVTI